jgi:transcriptional regulator with XRE-family HTH domain
MRTQTPTTRLPAPPGLGPRIRAEREQQRLDLQELAEAAQTNRITLYRIESGRTPYLSVGTLMAIADALHVSTDYLLGRAESRCGH